MEVRDDALAAEIERILESNTFRNSEALRRLLKFLAEKRLAGEADQLKEYSVGIDALGKPPTYDPRHDSTVRIQVGRLRNKLAEYYRTEGKHDPVIVDLPKGRFKLTYDEPQTVSPRPAVALEEAPAPPSTLPCGRPNSSNCGSPFSIRGTLSLSPLPTHLLSSSRATVRTAI